jgi:hypothetical protein
MRITLIPLLISSALNAEPAFRLQPHAGKLSSPAITEASGLGVSPTDADFLWIINDSGGTNEIHLTDKDGTHRGSISVEGTTNRDWEDLASFMFEGKPYLLIADTGDNGSTRESVTLHIVRQPALPTDGNELSGKIPVAWEIEFTFEDGPRDCEAVAVDGAAGKIILISKRTEPPGVYELPLRPGMDAVARKIGETETKATGFTLPLAFRNQPTGLDISADGTMAAVSTYHGAFLFLRESDESWAETFARKPVPLGPHGLPQAEAIAFAPDGGSIHVLSEGKQAPIADYLAAP